MKTRWRPPETVYDIAAGTYVQFVGTDISSATECPIDRSLLVAFIELIKRQAISRVADVGCGPGRVAAFMADHGLDVFGVDVSQAMLAIASTAHPTSSSKRANSMRFPSNRECSLVRSAGTRLSIHLRIGSSRRSTSWRGS